MSLGLVLMISGATIITLVAGGAYGFLRLRSELSHATIVGKEARILQWHGSKGRVIAAGREWTAYAADPAELHPGDKVLISRMDHDALKIQPVEQDVEAVDLV